jgi:hypothetical protein
VGFQAQEGWVAAAAGPNPSGRRKNREGGWATGAGICGSEYQMLRAEESFINLVRKEAITGRIHPP